MKDKKLLMGILLPLLVRAEDNASRTVLKICIEANTYLCACVKNFGLIQLTIVMLLFSLITHFEFLHLVYVLKLPAEIWNENCTLNFHKQAGYSWQIAGSNILCFIIKQTKMHCSNYKKVWTDSKSHITTCIPTQHMHTCTHAYTCTHVHTLVHMQLAQNICAFTDTVIHLPKTQKQYHLDEDASYWIVPHITVMGHVVNDWVNWLQVVTPL